MPFLIWRWYLGFHLDPLTRWHLSDRAWGPSERKALEVYKHSKKWRKMDSSFTCLGLPVKERRRTEIRCFVWRKGSLLRNCLFSTTSWDFYPSEGYQDRFYLGWSIAKVERIIRLLTWWTCWVRHVKQSRYTANKCWLYGNWVCFFQQDWEVCLSNTVFILIYPPENDRMSHENQWLEDVFPIEIVPF